MKELKLTPHEERVCEFYDAGIWWRQYYPWHFDAGFLNRGFWQSPDILYHQAAVDLIFRLARQVGINQENRVLDIGCGTGAGTISIADALNPELVTGVDIDWKHMSFAGDLNQDYKGTNAAFFYRNATNLPFDDESYSHVIAIDSLWEMETRKEALQEAYRVLKPGGSIISTDLFLLGEINQTACRGFVSFARHLLHVHQDNMITSNDVPELYANVGFRNLSMEAVGTHVFPRYYRNRHRPDAWRLSRRARGLWRGVVRELWRDSFLMTLYGANILDYFIVEARKPEHPVH